MGYDVISKAYRIHIPATRETIVSRSVRFMGESAFREEYTEIYDEVEGSTRNEIVINSSQPSTSCESDTSTKEETLVQEDAEKQHPIVPPRGRKRGATISWEELVPPPKRGRGRPRLVRTGSRGRPRKQYASAPLETNDDRDEEVEDEILEDDVFTANAAVQGPSTWQEAVETDDTEAWRIAMEDEYLAQIKNCTWEIVPRPKDRKVIGSRFVFRTKNTGGKEKKKVRLVAKG